MEIEVRTYRYCCEDKGRSGVLPGPIHITQTGHLESVANSVKLSCTHDKEWPTNFDSTTGGVEMTGKGAQHEWSTKNAFVLLGTGVNRLYMVGDETYARVG